MNTLEQNGLAAVATWLKQKESITHNSNFFWWSLAVRVIQVPLYGDQQSVRPTRLTLRAMPVDSYVIKMKQLYWGRCRKCRQLRKVVVRLLWG